MVHQESVFLSGLKKLSSINFVIVAIKLTKNQTSDSKKNRGESDPIFREQGFAHCSALINSVIEKICPNCATLLSGCQEIINNLCVAGIIH